MARSRVPSGCPTASAGKIEALLLAMLDQPAGEAVEHLSDTPRDRAGGIGCTCLSSLLHWPLMRNINGGAAFA
jgi:hypothetical protein